MSNFTALLADMVPAQRSYHRRVGASHRAAPAVIDTPSLAAGDICCIHMLCNTSPQQSISGLIEAAVAQANDIQMSCGNVCKCQRDASPISRSAAAWPTCREGEMRSRRIYDLYSGDYCIIYVTATTCASPIIINIVGGHNHKETISCVLSRCI